VQTHVMLLLIDLYRLINTANKECPFVIKKELVTRPLNTYGVGGA